MSIFGALAHPAHAQPTLSPKLAPDLASAVNAPAAAGRKLGEADRERSLLQGHRRRRRRRSAAHRSSQCGRRRRWRGQLSVSIDQGLLRDDSGAGPQSARAAPRRGQHLAQQARHQDGEPPRARDRRARRPQPCRTRNRLRRQGRGHRDPRFRGLRGARRVPRRQRRDPPRGKDGRPDAGERLGECRRTDVDDWPRPLGRLLPRQQGPAKPREQDRQLGQQRPRHLRARHGRRVGGGRPRRRGHPRCDGRRAGRDPV